MEKETYVDIPDGDDIAQGDVIKIEEFDVEGHLRPEVDYGIVITADCDIAQKKMGDHYTYVRVISAIRYLEEYWSVVSLKEKKKKIHGEAAQKIRKLYMELNPEATLLSERDLDDWLSESTVESIVGNLDAQGKDKRQLEELLEKIKTINTGLSVGRCLGAFVELKGMDGAKKENIEKEVAIALEKKLPEQYVFLPSLANEEHIGAVVLLRDVRSMRQDLLSPNYAEYKLIDAPRKAVRIARLIDNIKYSITQKFGYLFSRIGHPVIFEKQQKTTVELLCSDINYLSVAEAKAGTQDNV